MRMTRQDRALKSYSVAWAPNAEGLNQSTLTLVASFNGDIQPLGRNTSRQAEFGLDSTEAKARALYYDNDVTLLEGYVVIDQTDSARYLVNGPPNIWAGHSEAITVKWNGNGPA